MTVNVLPVSNGTVQLTGSGERIKICSGDLTRVGSGGDFIMCSTSGCGSGLGPVVVVVVASPSSPALKHIHNNNTVYGLRGFWNEFGRCAK